MDYRLTDTISDLPGISEKFHTEKLLRLQHGFLCYQPPADAPSIGELPVKRNGHITLGCFNDSAKINQTMVNAWCKILNLIPQSNLLLKASGYSDKFLKHNILQMFDKNQMDHTRIEFCEMTASFYDHLNLYNEIDIALDTFPYNGTTTTCEALWMGVPVISFA